MFLHQPIARLLTAAVVLLAAAPLQAAVCELRSPPHRVGLLELYTSEGCNSCPPADRWLSRQRAAQRPDRLVALAFHVDYWNQLGWPDRFSHARNTRRQQQAAERNRAGFVYTPQFLLDGHDVRPLRDAQAVPQRLATLHAQPALAEISARVTLEGREIKVQGHSTLTQSSPSAETFIALYEHDLTSAVARGENAGKTLTHDYVVRGWVGPLLTDARGVSVLDHRIGLPADARTPQLGVAVFTQDRHSGRVLQAAAAQGCLEP